MNVEQLFEVVLEHLDAVIARSSTQGTELWTQLLQAHPADIAHFLSTINTKDAEKLFLALPRRQKLKVFYYVPDYVKVLCLSLLPEAEHSFFLSSLSIDELTDFFDDLSDEDLKKYLKLLHKKDREKVVSMLNFEPDSAGHIMHTDVITLMQDFTIEKSIKIMQRLKPTKDLHRIIYITNQENELVGHINLEDLVLRDPKTRLSSILRKDPVVVLPDRDQEKVAQDMMHYKLQSVPVVSDTGIFLGIITTDNVVHIIEREAAEDVYRMSALAPIKETYFQTPFFSLFYQRGAILAVLLLVQVFSQLIISHYEALLAMLGLLSYLTMIASTGGNTSSQTSALVIQGLTSGEISDNSASRFLKREMLIAFAIGAMLGAISFLRIILFDWFKGVAMTGSYLLKNFAVSLSLAIIVLVSVLLGGVIPIILKKLKLDPALSAGPFLATIMDVLGILIYCIIASLFFNLS